MDLQNNFEKYIKLGKALANYYEENFKTAPNEVALDISGLIIGVAGRDDFFSDENIEDLLVSHVHEKYLVDNYHFECDVRYCIPENIIDELDQKSQVAVITAILTLRNAGFPILHTNDDELYCQKLPKNLGDEMGLITLSPYINNYKLLSEIHDYLNTKRDHAIIDKLEELWVHIPEQFQHSGFALRIQSWLYELLNQNGYAPKEKFLSYFETTHFSQIAKTLGINGPYINISDGDSSITAATMVAHDWIFSGRCKSVLVVYSQSNICKYIKQWSRSFIDTVNEDFFYQGSFGFLLESKQEIQKRGMNGQIEVLYSDIRNIPHINTDFTEFLKNIYNIKHKTLIYFLANEEESKEHIIKTMTKLGNKSESSFEFKVNKKFSSVFKQAILLKYLRMQNYDCETYATNFIKDRQNHIALSTYKKLTNTYIEDYIQYKRWLNKHFEIEKKTSRDKKTIIKPAEVNDILEIKRMIPEIIESPIIGKIEKKISLENKQKTVLVVADKEQGAWEILAQKFMEEGAKVVLLTDHENIISESVSVYHTSFHDFTKLHDALEVIAENHSSIYGIIYLLGLEDNNYMRTLKLSQWRKETHRKVKSLFFLTRFFVKELLRFKKRGSFVVAASMMGGNFGLRGFDGKNPSSGGIVGFLKAFDKEFPEIRVKACDFKMNSSRELIAKLLWQEIAYGDDKIEICFSNDIRSTIQVIPLPLYCKKQPNIPLGTESVFVISGGIQGITASIAKDLAKHFRPRTILLDVLEIPENIKKLSELEMGNKEQFREEVHKLMLLRHGAVSDEFLEHEIKHYYRAVNAYRNMEELRQLGANVTYKVCDVTDEGHVHKAIQDVVNTYGKIDVVIHGANLEDVKGILEKEPSVFCSSFDVKVDGCFNLVNETMKYGLKYLVLFSSIVGRFGNQGQTDYSAACELLNKYAAWLNYNYPIKAISLNWTAWSEVGLSTRETVRRTFKEAGVTLIPLDKGIPMVRREILFSDNESEIILAGNVSYLDKYSQIVPSSRSRAARQMQKLIGRSSKHFYFLRNIVEFIPKRSLKIDMDTTSWSSYLYNNEVLPRSIALEMIGEAATTFYPNLNVCSIGNIQFKNDLRVINEKLSITIELISSLPHQKRLRAKIISGEEDVAILKCIILMKPPKELFLEENFSFCKDGLLEQLTQEEIYKILSVDKNFHICKSGTYYEDQSFTTSMDYKQEKLNPHSIKWILNPYILEFVFQSSDLYKHKQEKTVINKVSFNSLHIKDMLDISCHISQKNDDTERELPLELKVISNNNLLITAEISD